MGVKLIVGAVVGYSSSQELIKLTRELRSIQPDWVVSYHGVTEVDLTVENYHFVSSYKEYLMKRMTGEISNGFLPNSARVFKQLLNIKHSSQYSL